MLAGGNTPSPLNRWVIMGVHPEREWVLHGNTLSQDGQCRTIDSAEELFAVLEAARQQARCWPEEKKRYDLPMAGGLAGVLGYGFGRWCEAGCLDWPAPDGEGFPDAVLLEYRDWLLINVASHELVVLSDAAEARTGYAQLWESVRLTEPGSGGQSADAEGREDLTDWQASFTPAAFEAAVARIRNAIRAGEIYQANLSIRFQRQLSLDPLALFETLCRRNPSPFGGVLLSPFGTIVSNSPERLVAGDETGGLSVRPIAGTRGRGKTPEEDAAIGQSLLENEKELAEHRMLVDLARNDLGRVCVPGSVGVDELLVLERYSHVTHLVSNVIGHLREDCSGWDALRSVFPGGTITGCPKLRCMEILQREEPVPRGFYTGSLGYMDAASPAMDWNILIRSLFLKQGSGLRYNAAMQVGAGIVHDSVAAHEYRECLRKAEAMRAALRESETSAASTPQS